MCTSSAFRSSSAFSFFLSSCSYSSCSVSSYHVIFLKLNAICRFCTRCLKSYTVGLWSVCDVHINVSPRRTFLFLNVWQINHGHRNNLISQCSIKTLKVTMAAVYTRQELRRYNNIINDRVSRSMVEGRGVNSPKYYQSCYNISAQIRSPCIII